MAERKQEGGHGRANEVQMAVWIVTVLLAWKRNEVVLEAGGQSSKKVDLGKETRG